MKPFLLFILLLPGCMTVTQKPVVSHFYSYDGNDQNSGVIAKTMDGFKVTSHFRDRYNNLIELYGSAKLDNGAHIFIPPLTKDTGIKPNSDGTYEITAQAMTYMVQMSELQRRGFKS